MNSQLYFIAGLTAACYAPFVAHVILTRVFGRYAAEDERQSGCLAGCACGLPAAAAVFFAGRSLFPAGDPFSLAVYLALVYGLAAYTYFHFFNISETSRRIKLLTILSRGDMDGRELAARYDPWGALRRRLARLSGLGELTEREGRFFLARRRLLMCARAVFILRSVLFPPERTGINAFSRHRELFRALLVRGFKAKYKNSFLGIFWSLLNPLLNVLVFAVIFTFILKLPVREYPLYLLCAIFPWSFFNGALTNSAVAIVEDAHFVKNTAFPVALIPLAVIAVNFVNFIVDCSILLLVLAAMGRANIYWVFLPAICLVELALVCGLGLLCAGAFVKFRDVNFILNFFLRLFFYFCPVVYTLGMVPSGLRALYLSNPLAVIIDQFTCILYQGNAPDAGLLLLAAGESAVICGACFWLFNRMKPTIPERL